MYHHTPYNCLRAARALLLLALWALTGFGVATVTLLPRQAEAATTYNIEVNKGTLVRLGRPASTVIVADPEVADVQVISPVLVYINGRRIGETSVLAVDENDHELLHAVVTVTHNLSKLNQTLKSLIPDSNVQFGSIDGALVISGDVESPLEAENVRSIAQSFVRGQEVLINMVNARGSDQVTLMVRVAEVSRTELKRFGIHLENLLNTGNFVFGLATGRDVVDVDGIIPRSGADGSLYVGHRSGSSNINGVIDALEDEGLISVLAEPNLTAMSGKPASFLAGGEFPVPVAGENQAVTIEYRPFGVSLNFTPVVLAKDRISLTVAPEVSTLSQIGSVTAAGFNIPSLVTRRASTTVELGSGQSFAIAGLLQNDHNNDISKFPGLGDVPVLGTLFRSSEFRNDQTELVIIVTPYVVSGVAEQQLVTPVDGYTPPSDFERILLGKLYREQDAITGGSANAQASGGMELPRLHGSAGYILK